MLHQLFAMNFDRLFQVLSSMHPISEKFRDAIQKELVPLSLPRNHLLLEAPNISEHAYFINSGCAMSFTYSNGEKCIEEFWQARQIVVSAKSFFERAPSLEFIQLIERSEVFCIGHASVMRLLDEFPEANFIQRVVMNQYYEFSKQKIRDMNYLTAEHRHEKFLRSFPGIEQIVSQEYIASYLGITPQSLSRIKRKRASSLTT
ncbi:MAG: Crp/Fnr family transcriptional regulator [Bacteroidetes bacterium]|nr:Crp/Fnr family transcriptional regulator [Bacteroidota bacterium]